MADISTITDLSGTTYNLKDTTARDSLVPSGGSDGQVLTRVGSQGAYAWQDPSGGGNVNTVNQISPDANKNVQTMVELTQAQYDALPASKNSDNVAYYITDGSFPEPTASTVSYDNTQSGMSATTVQGALDELNSNIEYNNNFVTDIQSGVVIDYQRLIKTNGINVVLINFTTSNSLAQYTHLFNTVPAGYMSTAYTYSMNGENAQLNLSNSWVEVKAGQTLEAGQHSVVFIY